jgi:hypothetical protein
MGLWPLGKTMTASQQTAASLCSFCSRPQSVVGSMVEGPNAAFICADCVRLAARVADANAGKLLPVDLDPIDWRSAHMNLVCYVRVHRGEDGAWTAEASSPTAFTAQGSTAKEAVRRLQTEVLQRAAKALSDGKDVGSHFSNHADASFR